MALHGKVGKDFQPVVEGVHPATCVSVFDLGTQHGGKYGPKHKIYLSFELADEPREGEDGKAWRARAFAEVSTSLHEKSNLRKLLEGWGGRKLLDEEAEAIDLMKLAGKAAMVWTANNAGGYPEIVMLKPVPPGVAVPRPMAKVQTYEMGQALPEGLPEWLMRKITAAPEFIDAAPDGPGGADQGGVVPF